MNNEMAVRDNRANRLIDSTPFVMHKSQQGFDLNSECVIIDYTEHKLLNYAKHIKDATQQLTVIALLKDYKDGKVAIAWKSGAPRYIRVISGV